MTSTDNTPSVEGKLAIVTGGGSGIGRAIVTRLVRAGYACVLAGRRKDKLDETVERATAEGGGGRAVAVAADITTEEGRATILETADAQPERLSALANNAGGTYIAPLFAQDVNEWRANFTLNVEASAFLSFQAMRRMSENGGGAIVNIASVYGIVGLNDTFYEGWISPEGPDGPERGVAYAACKGALRQMSRELAVAGAKMAVRVNSVSPGMIQVDRQRVSQENVDRLNKATPMGRMGQPEEIAGAVNFLLSSEASFITGVDLVVDGGWTIW